MKKLISGTVFLITVILVFVGCEKKQIQEVLEEGSTKQNVHNTKKSDPAGDPLVILANNLSDINAYLNECEEISNDHFFSFWLSNPNSTLSDLENAGFISESTMLSMFTAIETSADVVDDEDVVWNLITQNIDPLFYDPNIGGQQNGIIIFRCVGCLDGIKGNNCYTSLIWTWGKGC